MDKAITMDMTRKTSMDLRLSSFERMDKLRSKLVQEGFSPRDLANKNLFEYFIHSPLFEVVVREAVGDKSLRGV